MIEIRENTDKDATSINVNKIYKIETKLNPELVFEIEKGGRKDKTKIVLGKSMDVTYQFFKLHRKSDSNYMIESLHIKNKVIDIYQRNNKDGTQIEIYERNDTDAQIFHIVEVGEGYYSFLSSSDNNFCLDIKSGVSNPGNVIWLYHRNFSDAQKFKLVGKNFLNYSMDYALEYAQKRNPDYEVHEPNSTNFCSQCLVAGGVDEDEIWTKNSEAFVDPLKFKEYFVKKGVEWKENPTINEIMAGDIIFIQYKSNLHFPLFVVRTTIDKIVFCSNSEDKKESFLKVETAKGILKTSSLFK
jgi:hypothetical protein